MGRIAQPCTRLIFAPPPGRRFVRVWDPVLSMGNLVVSGIDGCASGWQRVLGWDSFGPQLYSSLTVGV